MTDWKIKFEAGWELIKEAIKLEKANPVEKYCQIEKDIYNSIGEAQEMAMEIWGVANKLRDELEATHLKLRDLIEELQAKGNKND